MTIAGTARAEYGNEEIPILHQLNVWAMEVEDGLNPCDGNGVCEAWDGVNKKTCPIDCAHDCGDRFCDIILETASACPSDCVGI